MMVTVTLLGALLLDALLGDPRRWHPLAAFGSLAARIEARCNNGSALAGTAATVGLVVLPALLLGVMAALLPGYWSWFAAAVIAAMCLGRRSLGEHVRAVATPLAAQDLAAARRRVAWLVSRETGRMDAAAVRRAAIESLLENASDAVFASLFWFALGGLLAGPEGAVVLVVVHRLANTLDAMWGYRSARLRRFGRCAAKLDDGLNWLPARATAAGFALLGDTAAAVSAWRSQARQCPSPNGGPVMSAGAGALGVWLGGGAYYLGTWQPRAWLGSGRAPGNGAIERALALVTRTLALFCLMIAGLDWLIA